MGVVYKARHVVLDKLFAVKVLRLDSFDSIGVLRFQQEAKAASILRHEHTEAIDLNTALGRAMAGVLSVFAEFELEMLSERVKAGIAQARKKGRNHGRPKTAALHETKIHRLFAQGQSKAEIARKLGIGRTSVIRILAQPAEADGIPKQFAKKLPKSFAKSQTGTRSSLQ